MQSPEIIRLVPVSPPELEQLSCSLRALPQVAPEHSAWEEIAPKLQAASARNSALRTRTRGRWIVLAAAASLAVAWLGAAQWNRIAAPATGGAATTAINEELAPRDDRASSAAQAALIERSGSLERWLVDSGSAQWPQDFGSASASVEIENLIANVDQRLSRSVSGAERNQLWQRRVGLLEQLVALQGEPLALSLASTSPAMVL
ncbi:MAG: hypothetical protein ABIP49_08015 [Lysobacterales bacterium]